MAPANLRVHPQQVAAHGARIRSAAQAVHGLNSSLHRELAGHGSPWGSDVVGLLMGACYGAISSLAAQSLASHAAALDGQGARVQAMAAAWQVSDDTSALNVLSLGQKVAGTQEPLQ